MYLPHIYALARDKAIPDHTAKYTGTALGRFLQSKIKWYSHYQEFVTVYTEHHEN